MQLFSKTVWLTFKVQGDSRFAMCSFAVMGGML